MILRTYADCSRFLNENSEGDWILHLVPVEDGVHPVTTAPSLLFIRNVLTGKNYVYPIDHPDGTTEVRARFFIANCISHAKNRKWVLDKKSFIELLGLRDLLDANLCGFMRKNVIIDPTEFETTAHHMVRRFSRKIGKINKTIPLMKHLEAFSEMADSIEKFVKGFPIDEAYSKINGTVIDTLAEMERNGIYVNSELYQKHFEVKPDSDGLVYSQYNIYTSTGRPSNRFGGVNYAALKKEDGSRSAFVSRYGDDGRMLVIDYSAFHPRIICMLTGYNVPTTTDIYTYLAQLYFQREDIDETDLVETKKLTFRQLYGGVEQKYQHIKYLAHLKTFIDKQWEFFKEYRYVETPLFKRKITDKHIQEPNPTKLFNYILQAVEGEVAIPCLSKVMKYLRGRQTKAVLYTYDAVLYDFHRADGKPVLEEIQRLMSMDGLFPMKTYLGTSYHSLALVN